MAQNRCDDTPASTLEPEPARTRIDGIDAARALAVFGMFVVHLGVESMGLLPEENAWTVHGLVRGNSSALFALLAGVSLALMTGRTIPVSGDPLRRSVVRILTRALLIGLLGLFLDVLAVPVAVILTYYAGFFVLALPLVRMRAGVLWAVAGTLAVLGPAVSFALRSSLIQEEPRTASLSSLTEFLLTGYYPAITFMAFVFAGMAVGRMDLAATGARVRLLITGAVLLLIGHGGSWLLLNPLGGLDRLVEARSPTLRGEPLSAIGDPTLVASLRYAVTDEMHSISGQVPTDSWWWLAVGTPHTGTTFEIAEAVGQGLLVLVVCMWLAERVWWLMYPLASVGRMPLTVYTGHLLVLAVVVATSGPDWHEPWILEQFVVGALLLATLWRALVGQGPAEAALKSAADGAVETVEEVRRNRRGG